TWLIDHGASFYFHHAMSDHIKASATPFPIIKDHALLGKANKIEQADELMRARLTPERLEAIVDLVPDTWLTSEEQAGISPSQMRDIYKDFLLRRLDNSDIFLKQAIDEHRKKLI
ncbi:MAG: aminotransferase class I and II, partial [Duncaniella sp.]|nr:aminotransferase class I and II [Duncaniella sp.]